jgi:hypothetical protein
MILTEKDRKQPEGGDKGRCAVDETSNDLIDLARRAVASPHWWWLPGMRVVCAGSDKAFRVCSVQRCRPGGELPDLSDPVTVKAVGILACKAFGADAIDVSVGVAPDMSGLPRVLWTARSYRGQRIASGSTLSRHVREAAYVAALLAAPAPEER